ncbi:MULTISPECIES: hypothetical protein [Hoyosella]|uniref:Uncharacterized protein n=2 Tax=Hoyosella TaxID=697025 RepID=F6EMA9_HOYSD|nr:MULTISPECIES: hypothetical protein [Hoyosella]AEF39315.1 hypothetical protein AS9A_0863 [Hoyosella subflava DQS3-9A1]MBB3039343.1 hypothetical protein [Hoyosella altamirensis]
MADNEAPLNLDDHVDEAEKRITRERKEKGVPGNAEEREAVDPVEPDDQAPE